MYQREGYQREGTRGRTRGRREDQREGGREATHEFPLRNVAPDH